jgi:hypothetical protein
MKNIAGPLKYKYEATKFKQHSHDKSLAKENIIKIEEILGNFINILNEYKNDIDKLLKSIDTQGFDLSLRSYKIINKRLVNEFLINCEKTLSNNSNAFNFKFNTNKNKIISVKTNHGLRNFEITNQEVLNANNSNLDHILLSNDEDNYIKLTIGNNQNINIKVGYIILIENTSNFNGFFKCTEILKHLEYSKIDGEYKLFANNFKNIPSETYQQLASVSIYDSYIEEVSVGYLNNEVKSFILSGDPSQIFNAESTDVSNLTISCNNDGEISLTTDGGTFINSTNFAVGNIVKIDGSNNSLFNGYFRVKTAGNDTSCILYAGSITSYIANNITTEVTASSNPFVNVSSWLSSNVTEILNLKSTAISKNKNADVNIGTASSTNDIKGSISQFDIIEDDGILTITLTNGTFASTTSFGDIIEISNTTNFDGFYMVAESLSSASSTIKCFSGDKRNLYENETLTTPNIYSNTYSKNQIPVFLNPSTNKQYELNNLLKITADDNADGYLKFQNVNYDEIKLTIGKKCQNHSISSTSVIEIKNTINYNGTWYIKNIITYHSSSSHGVYILHSHNLENKDIEIYYSNAEVTVYDTMEYSLLNLKNISKSTPFLIKFKDGNKHNAFYIPGITIFSDDSNIIELVLCTNISKFGVEDGGDKVNKYRISGKNKIPQNIEDLKNVYLQIINDELDNDKISPQLDIEKLISEFNIIKRSISYVKNSSYV